MTAVLEGGEWSAARPGRTLPPWKTRYPLYSRLGGPQGRSGRAENLVPTGDSIPDRQARSQSLYRLSHRAHLRWITSINYSIFLYRVKMGKISYYNSCSFPDVKYGPTWIIRFIWLGNRLITLILTFHMVHASINLGNICRLLYIFSVIANT